MMLSGKTGKLFGKRYLEMSDNRETYMSPMVYKTRDDSQYILFGSGGETIAGSRLKYVFFLCVLFFYLFSGL